MEQETLKQQNEMLLKMAQKLNKDSRKPVPLPISQEEIYQLGQKCQHPITQFLLYWLYLSGQRVSEMLQTKRRHVSLETSGNQKFIIINSISLKSDKRPRRNIAIPVDNQMAEYCWKRLQQIPFDEPLIRITRTNAWNYLAKIQLKEIDAILPQTKEMITIDFKMHPHFLRHCRASHLANKNWELFKLMNFFGWESSEMASLYANMNWQALAQEFIKNK